MITVEVRLTQSSFPIIHTNVINAYTKGKLYCIYRNDNKVYKYPIQHIFAVIEDYSSIKEDSK